MRRTPLRKTSKSPVALCKARIQALLREIAILRDGGCFLRNRAEFGQCGGYGSKSGKLIQQFDHLNTRERNISYGDPRLGVCVCLRHHFYFKKQYPYEYEKAAREFIGPERTALLERVKADRKTYAMGIYEWGKIEIALKQELKQYG
jgi:hypothetical protein